jgi:RHS repeat-associated protein
MWQGAPEGSTLYFDAFGVHSELFISGTSSWYDYVSAGGAMIAVQVTSGSTVTQRFFHTDNLGSISVITDQSGNVVERDGYDAWGKRRFPNGADDPTDSLTSQTTRGFTAQEELHDVGLVHLNGRVYDPLIARMTSADPMVPDPMNGQAWNRYSYVVNNPLAFTDPSGYCFLGMCGFDNAFSNFFNNIFKQIGRVLRSTPILGNLAVAGAAALCAGPQAIVCAVAAAFLTTTAVAGLTSGNIGTGLKAGAIAAATAVAFWEVGNLTMPNGPAAMSPAQYAENVAGHALVGCGQAAASGQNCGPSALAAGVTSAAGPVINGYGVSSLVANAALGGGAAVLAGGKFANGAITAAFGYLFNNTMHLGGSVQIPGIVAQGLTYIYQALGWTNTIEESGAYVGIVVQYTSASDRAAGLSIPLDIGYYYGGSVSAVDVGGLPTNFSGMLSWLIGFSAEAGVGSGAIHGTFDGTSQNVSGASGFGASATFSTDQSGNSYFSGVAVRFGLQVGISYDTSVTTACTYGGGCTK